MPPGAGRQLQNSTTAATTTCSTSTRAGPTDNRRRVPCSPNERNIYGHRAGAGMALGVAVAGNGGGCKGLERQSTA